MIGAPFWPGSMLADFFCTCLPAQTDLERGDIAREIERIDNELKTKEDNDDGTHD